RSPASPCPARTAPTGERRLLRRRLPSPGRHSPPGQRHPAAVHASLGPPPPWHGAARSPERATDPAPTDTPLIRQETPCPCSTSPLLYQRVTYRWCGGLVPAEEAPDAGD